MVHQRAGEEVPLALTGWRSGEEVVEGQLEVSRGREQGHSHCSQAWGEARRPKGADGRPGAGLPWAAG